MKAKEKKSFVSSRIVLSLGLLIVAVGGLLYKNQAHPLRLPALATCQNQVLWPTNHLENQKSCPISPDSETVTIFWNQQNLGSDSQLIASLVSKINAHLIERAEHLKIQIDAALVSVDKITHQVVEKKFTNFSKYYSAKFKPDTEITYEVPVVMGSLNPQHYYRLEVYDLRVYLMKYEYRYKLEYFKNRKILVNALFSTSPLAPFSRVRQIQLPAFVLLALISAYFLYRLLGVDSHRLCDPVTWLVLLSTVAAALYLYPAALPFLTPMYAFVVFQFTFSSALDCMVFGRSLPQPLNTLLPFASIFINFVAAGFSILGMRDTHKEPFPVTKDARIDISVDFQVSVRIIVNWKLALQLAALLIGYLRVHALPKTYIYMVPTLVGVCGWVRAVAKTESQYLEDSKNPADVWLDFAFVPLLLLILQYTVADSPRSYLGLPPAESTEPVLLSYFQRLGLHAWQKIGRRDTAIETTAN
jgi:hypothetical protein